MRIANRLLFVAPALLIACACAAQQSQKPLTNADVIKMVKAGVPESVIVSSIQSSPGKYDVSPDGLVALHKAGLTQNEMDAVMSAMKAGSGGGSASSATGNGAGPPPPNPAPGSAASAPPPSAPAEPVSHLPTAMINLGGVSQELPLERTQLAQTKTKPSSMKSLAADSTLTQGVQAGVNTAAYEGATHTSSSAASIGISQSGSILNGALSKRKPPLTYVWAVPGPASANVLQIATPQLTLDFSNVAGANPDDFEPAVVKLTPTPNALRLVGATQGKDDALSTSGADWSVYSGFLEDRVAVNSQKLGKGQYKISPLAPLLPGEYAVVLRPVSKTKKFSGADVARDQGDGQMFDSVWSFQITQDAK